MSGAYIIHKFRTLPAVYELMRELTTGLDEQTYLLFAHIVACTLLKWREEEIEELFSPVDRNLIRAKIGRKANWKDLQDRKLIEIRPYCKERHLARRYKAADRVLDRIHEIISALSYYEYFACKKVNLMTGESLNPSGHVPESRLTYNDANRSSLPKEYCTAVKELGRNKRRFNWTECEKFIEDQRDKKDTLKAEFERIKSEQGKDSEESKKAKRLWLRAERQWRNNHYCFLAVLDRQPQQLTKDIWCYQPRYNPSEFGRAYEEGGGFQSASKLRGMSERRLSSVSRRLQNRQIFSF